VGSPSWRRAARKAGVDRDAGWQLRAQVIERLAHHPFDVHRHLLAQAAAAEGENPVDQRAALSRG